MVGVNCSPPDQGDPIDGAFLFQLQRASHLSGRFGPDLIPAGKVAWQTIGNAESPRMHGR